MNDIDEELVQLDKEIEITEKFNDLQGLSVLYSNKGKIFLNQSNYKNSLDYITKSSKISIKENSPLLFASNIYSAGLCYEGLKDFKNAKAAFKLALSISKRIDNRDLGRKVITKLIKINKINRESPQGSNERQKKTIPKNFGFFHY